MKKTIIWIDDDANVMKEVVSYVFPELWEKDVKSYIFLTKEYENSVFELNRIIYDQFSFYITNKEDITDEEVEEKEKLVTTSDSLDPIADVVIDKSKIIKEHENAIKEQYYASRKKLETTTDEDNIDNSIVQYETTIEIIADNFKNIQKEKTDEETDKKEQISKDNNWYGIDLCLLDEDYDILRKGAKIPILSMALYNYFKRSKYKVFLYTTFSLPTNIIKSWQNTYAEFYDSKEKIAVYNRRGKCAYGDDKDDLINLICGG